MKINEQVKELRELADISGSYGEMIIKQAINTIEDLSSKLSVKNMEWSERYYGSDVLSKVIAELDERIAGQLSMTGLGDVTCRYGYRKSLEAYQQSKMIVEQTIKEYKEKQSVADCGGRWIPCSEKLPEKHTDVLVAFSHDDDTVIAWYSKVKKQWKNSSTGNVIKAKVVAWQPLPEPYHEP